LSPDDLAHLSRRVLDDCAARRRDVELRHHLRCVENAMIILLTFTNSLPIAVELRSNMGTGQPVAPGQVLEMTFELQDDGDGVGDLVLICEPGRVVT
jgi:hypothetical protein